MTKPNVCKYIPRNNARNRATWRACMVRQRKLDALWMKWDNQSGQTKIAMITRYYNLKENIERRFYPRVRSYGSKGITLFGSVRNYCRSKKRVMVQVYNKAFTKTYYGTTPSGVTCTERGRDPVSRTPYCLVRFSDVRILGAVIVNRAGRFSLTVRTNENSVRVFIDVNQGGCGINTVNRSIMHDLVIPVTRRRSSKRLSIGVNRSPIH
jgi:hypothetical protein